MNSNVDEIIKDKVLPGWQFGIENKTNKDTFSIKNRYNKASHNTSKTNKNTNLSIFFASQILRLNLSKFII